MVSREESDKHLSTTNSGRPESRIMPRRCFIRSGVLAAAAAVLLRGSPFLDSLTATAQESPADLVHDTLNGLIAFVVPGPDIYSVAQGVNTIEAGGLDTGIAEILIESLDESAPYLPQFSAIVGAILNNLAQVVNAAAPGNLISTFARLKFSEKVAVFRIMDSADTLKPLAGILPVFVAFLCYSDAGVFDSETRSLTGQPVGWDISHYGGVADGRNEFLGYFENRRSATR